MPNGFGRAFGRGFGRGGWGFGFRGSSPPWPYVGLGRGGLPRCGYSFRGAPGIPFRPGYPEAMPYGYAGAPVEGMPGTDAYAPQMTQEQELTFLESQAETLESELDAIRKRLEELRK